jgi:HSP20 family protein
MYPALTRFPGDLFGDFELLQRQVEQLLGNRGQPASIRAANKGAFPAINVGNTPEGLEIHAFAPAIDLGKLEVFVDRGLLTIAGERVDEPPAESETVSVFAAERFRGPFRRVISLPEDADAARVDATYRDGVLRIAIPKRESSRPRRVEVKAQP